MRSSALLRRSAVGATGRSFHASRAALAETQWESTPWKDITVGIPAETMPLEKRVAGSPASVAELVKHGFSVNVQAGAGAAAKFPDSMYEAAGATIKVRADSPEFCCGGPAACPAACCCAALPVPVLLLRRPPCVLPLACLPCPCCCSWCCCC